MRPNMEEEDREEVRGGTETPGGDREWATRGRRPVPPPPRPTELEVEVEVEREGEVEAVAVAVATTGAVPRTPSSVTSAQTRTENDKVRIRVHR
jgi:hypothetical protein